MKVAEPQSFNPVFNIFNNFHLYLFPNLRRRKTRNHKAGIGLVDYWIGSRVVLHTLILNKTRLFR